MTVTTPLQRHLRQALDVLEDARVELTVEEWSWLVAILAEAIGIEVGNGCPLVAAVHHPEHRDALMALNARLERTAPAGTAEALDRVQRALEDLLRARVRHARRGA